MKNLPVIFLAIFTAILGAVIAVKIIPPQVQTTAAETTFDQVKKTGVLRCGYIVYEPYFFKDPNTGKMSGIFYDLVEEMGHRLSLKVEWTEEVGWGNFIAGMQSGRYDALCSGLSPNAAEAREMGYSIPVYYTAVGAYVRADDTRFLDKTGEERWAALNDKAIKISSMDGSLNSIIAKTDFPNAEIFSIPNMSDEAQMAENVSVGKADVNFMEIYRAAQYDKNNPGKLMNIDASKPIRVFPNVMGLPIGDMRMKSMVDNAIDELHYSGFVDQVLPKYEIVP
ncbi:MAG TPA: hypothetical protein DIS76_04375, partial [Rhodospirillaceae bacterium]|nr:hypothetical protein [Rhodospirillaceae bacterium]